jgi:small ligand-binding sensory domain FIST
VRIGSGLSQEVEARQAATEAALAARAALDGERPTLAVVFASPEHGSRADAVVDAVHEAAGPDALIGCLAEGVIGTSREIEHGPCVSVWLGSLPGEAESFRMEFSRIGDDGYFSGWPEQQEGKILLIGDPFSFPADLFLRHLNDTLPKTRVVGGMASGAGRPEDVRLFLGNEVVSSGAVGVRLPGAVEVLTLVSQGCRPVGETFTVTKGEGNVIMELAGRPPLERLNELHATLTSEERLLLARGLQLGRVIDEYKPEFGRGDFLVRGVLGADARSGAVAVGDMIEIGETVQFHVRDAASADEDLRMALGRARERLNGRSPSGALLFTCNGRGSRLFQAPNHDAGLVSNELGAVPLAGLFCAGEFGPVGGKNFLHGFTASMAVFCETHDLVEDPLPDIAEKLGVPPLEEPVPTHPKPPLPTDSLDPPVLDG